MKKIIKFFLIVLFMIIGMSMFTKVEAASANISASKTQANIGDNVTIKVTINAASWNLKVSGTGVTGESYADNTDDANNKTTIKTLYLDTTTVGTKVIKLSGDVSDGDTDVTSKISDSVTVVVNEKKVVDSSENNTSNNNTKSNDSNTKTNIQAKSSDATLKSITIGGKTYSKPNASITADNVSNETSSIKITAQVNNANAKVTGTGTKELSVGTNKFTIKVTAENGETKIYTVRVTRLAQENTTPNVIEETQEPKPTQEVPEMPKLRLSELNVEDVELIPEFSGEVFEYSVYVANVDEIKINAIPNIEGANVEITGNTELQEGENIVTIKLTKDEEVVEYKITVNKAGLSTIQEVTEDNVETPKPMGFTARIKDFWNKTGARIMVYATIGILLISAITFAILAYKYSNKLTQKSKISV